MYEAKAKVYRYSLWSGRCFNPFVQPFVWQVPPQSCLETIEKNLIELCGRHDFTSFCNIDSTAKTKERKIIEVKLVKVGQSIDIWFLGEGFLKQMIRIIVGTLVDLSLGKLKRTCIKEIVEQKDRTQAGRTAPAQGLFLFEVFFDNPCSLDEYLSSLDQKAFFIVNIVYNFIIVLLIQQKVF